MDSIFNTIKKLLGISEEDPSFDQDLIVQINSVFSILQQLGVIEGTGIVITGPDETWDLVIMDPRLEMIKTYVQIKCRLIFDPPTSSFVLEAYNQQAKEFEWRLREAAELIRKEKC